MQKTELVILKILISLKFRIIITIKSTQKYGFAIFAFTLVPFKLRKLLIVFLHSFFVFKLY